MPYQDPERRRQAARKWRQSNRAKRAAYMRRYRKTHSSGRPPGRPRSREEPHPLDGMAPEPFQPDGSRLPSDFGEISCESATSGDDSKERMTGSPAGERVGLPPSINAGIEWAGSTFVPWIGSETP
jgi:hypothetical protein